jgi:hypothetical protein
MLRGIARIAALVIAASGCASHEAAPETPEVPGGLPFMTIAVRGEGTQIATTIERLELRVDGAVKGSATGSTLDVTPADLAPGEHAIELDVFISGKADPAGRAAIWSTTERVRTAAGSSRLDVRLLLANDARPLTQRLEARFRSDKAELLGGSVPQLRAIDTSVEEAVALAKLGSNPPLDDARARVVRMNTVRSQIVAALAAARVEKDVVKTMCENDKLSQLDVAIRSAGERMAALQTAVQNGDANAAVHESTIIIVLAQRGDQLLADSRNCVGEDASAPPAAAVPDVKL